MQTYQELRKGLTSDQEKVLEEHPELEADMLAYNLGADHPVLDDLRTAIASALAETAPTYLADARTAAHPLTATAVHVAESSGRRDWKRYHETKEHYLELAQAARTPDAVSALGTSDDAVAAQKEQSVSQKAHDEVVGTDLFNRQKQQNELELSQYRDPDVQSSPPEDGTGAVQEGAGFLGGVSQSPDPDVRIAEGEAAETASVPAATDAEEATVEQLGGEQRDTDQVVDDADASNPTDPTVSDDEGPDYGTGRYEGRSFEQVQGLAKSRGVPAGGSKEDIIARLRGEGGDES